MIGKFLGAAVDLAEDVAEIGEALGVVPEGTADLIDEVDDLIEDLADWAGVDYD